MNTKSNLICRLGVSYIYFFSVLGAHYIYGGGVAVEEAGVGGGEVTGTRLASFDYLPHIPFEGAPLPLLTDNTDDYGDGGGGQPLVV